MHDGSRRFWRLVALVAGGGGALALLGLGSATASRSATTPQTGGELIFATNQGISCIDPQVAANVGASIPNRNVLESLVAQKAGGAIVPWLASSVKVSSDSKLYTFTLRKGIEFSDGTPLDASAVKANLDRIADPATKSQYATGLLGPYNGTDVVSKYVARVHFYRSFSPFLQAASTVNFGIQSPTALAKNPPCSPPVGTGPFVIQDFVAGQSLVLSRNTNYNSLNPLAGHKGRPYLDKVTFRFVSDDAVRDGAVQSKQVDLADAILPKDISAVGSAGYTVLRQTIPGVPDTAYLNVTNVPFDDVRVRQAFQRTVDIDSLLQTLYLGVYKRAWSPLSSATTGFDTSLVGSWKPDKALANKLLDQAGYTGRDGAGYRTKDGKRLVVQWPQADPREQRSQLALLIKDQEQKVGIDLEIVPASPGAIPQVLGNQYNVTDFPFYRNEPDILRSLFNGGNQPTATVYRQNVARVRDRKANAWTQDAAKLQDPAKRAKLYALVQQAAIKNAWVLPLYELQEIVAVKKDVQGIRLDGGQAYPTFYDAWVQK